MITAERPILFSGPMVRAILDGRKSQTRRIFKPEMIQIEPHPLYYQTFAKRKGEIDLTGQGPFIPEDWLHYCPYGQPGDRLWVKENWRPVGPWECREDCATIQYAADLSYSRKLGWPEKFRIKTSDRRDKWRPSIFMGRWASRITLEIVAVRVERLQDITEEDAQAEGVTESDAPLWTPDEFYKTRPLAARFAAVWHEVNGNRDLGWEVNPWVWVIAFRRV